MNDERLMNIIVSPRVSEKATIKADSENQHVFSVLNSELQEVLNAPLFISKICLVGENKMDGKFGVIEEFSLVD